MALHPCGRASVSRSVAQVHVVRRAGGTGPRPRRPFLGNLLAAPLLVGNFPRRRTAVLAALRFTAVFLAADKVFTTPQLAAAPKAGLSGFLLDAARCLLGEKGLSATMQRYLLCHSGPCRPTAIPLLLLTWCSNPCHEALPKTCIAPGSRSPRLLLFGVGQQLGLGARLLVQTMCLAGVLALLPDACMQPFLATDLMARRLAWLHDLMGSPLASILPPGYPPGQRAQCVSALSFLSIWWGWLVPTYVVLRAHWSSPNFVAQRQQSLLLDGSSQGSLGSSGGSGSGGGDAIAVRDRGSGGALRVRPAAVHRIALFAWEWLFFQDCPLTALRLQAWLLMCLLCWLGSTVLGLWLA
ncbi:hypothetical protein ABPG75_012760 [Micractinium tetrahymenae]